MITMMMMMMMIRLTVIAALRTSALRTYIIHAQQTNRREQSGNCASKTVLELTYEISITHLPESHIDSFKLKIYSSSQETQNSTRASTKSKYQHHAFYGNIIVSHNLFFHVNHECH